VIQVVSEKEEREREPDKRGTRRGESISSQFGTSPPELHYMRKQVRREAFAKRELQKLNN